MAGDISQFFGGIKSIQRGTISVAGGTSTQTATITAVDTTKSELRMLGAAFGLASEMPYIVLTNGTTISAFRSSSGGNTTVVSWELTETY